MTMGKIRHGPFLLEAVITVLGMTFPMNRKKDLESLIHQPNPALTVQQLPQNPKISFRKGHPSEKKEQVEITTSVPETSLAPHQGMKEVTMLRPNTGAVSPLYA